MSAENKNLIVRVPSAQMGAKMKIKLDQRGRECPIPVIEAKKAIEQAAPGTAVEVTVDNEIAVQNLEKLAKQKNVDCTSAVIGAVEFTVTFYKTEGSGKAAENCTGQAAKAESEAAAKSAANPGQKQETMPAGILVVLSSDQMGAGDETLGRLLMKGFVYSLTQQEQLPGTVILFNSGVRLACADSDSLGDLQALAQAGVEVLACGTCLDFYGLKDKLNVGGVSNMYEITERMMGAGHIVKPS